MTVVLGIAIGALVGPPALAAQQSASVVVRANVIKVPVAPAGLDSLTRGVRGSVSAATRARVIADARARGLRIAVSGASQPARRTGAVVLMEYVAN
jgi:hypothetical protein